VTIRLSRRTVPAIAHEILNQTWFGLQNFSKDVLPSSFTEQLKTLRRKWKRENQLSGLTIEKSGESL